MMRLTGDSADVWKIKGFAAFWRKARIGVVGVRSTAGRRAIVSGRQEKRSVAKDVLYQKIKFCQGANK
jgi:hypothetical protein